MTPEARMQTAQELLDQFQKLLKKYLADAQKSERYYPDPNKWLKDRDAIMKSLPEGAVTAPVMNEDAIYEAPETRDKIRKQLVKPYQFSRGASSPASSTGDACHYAF